MLTWALVSVLLLCMHRGARPKVSLRWRDLRLNTRTQTKNFACSLGLHASNRSYSPLCIATQIPDCYWSEESFCPARASEKGLLSSLGRCYRLLVRPKVATRCTLYSLSLYDTQSRSYTIRLWSYWKGSKYVSRLIFIGATIQFINSVVHTYMLWTWHS